MGAIELNNKIIEDRRKNGARLKLALRDWIWVGTLVVALLVWIVNLNFTTVANCEVLKEHKGVITTNTGKIGKIETNIDNINRDLAYIRNRVDDIYKQIK